MTFVLSGFVVANRFHGCVQAILVSDTGAVDRSPKGAVAGVDGAPFWQVKFPDNRESAGRIPYASEQGIFAHLCREICAQAGKICFPQEGTEFFDSPAQLEPGIACVQAANSVVPEFLMREAFEAFPTTHFVAPIPGELSRPYPILLGVAEHPKMFPEPRDTRVRVLDREIGVADLAYPWNGNSSSIDDRRSARLLYTAVHRNRGLAFPQYGDQPVETLILEADLF